MKRVGSSKKVWCSRLGSAKKFRETPLYVSQKLFGAIFALVYLNYTTLSQSESSDIFMCLNSGVIKTDLFCILKETEQFLMWLVQE